MNMHLKKEFRFEASHQLPNHNGKCARLHGHSWVLCVWVMGPVLENPGHPKEGMVVDYYDIGQVVKPIIELLDHRHLGYGIAEVEDADGAYGGILQCDKELWDKNFPIVPTSENILIWIAEQLPKDFNWSCLALNETCTSEARLYAVDYAAHNARMESSDV